MDEAYWADGAERSKAAGLLGCCTATIGRMRRGVCHTTGKPVTVDRRTALACAALAAGLDEWRRPGRFRYSMLSFCTLAFFGTKPQKIVLSHRPCNCILRIYSMVQSWQMLQDSPHILADSRQESYSLRESKHRGWVISLICISRP